MCAGLLLAGQGRPNIPANQDATVRLTGHFAAMKDIQTLQASFACEKQNSLLAKPLISHGRLWIRRGDIMKAGAGAIRFTTEQPNLSEFILADAKVYARSERDKKWTKSDQKSRPGLPAVMEQLGNWSTGEMNNVSELYSVAMGIADVAPGNAEVIEIPAADGFPAVKAKGDLEFFVLTPKNAELQKNIRQITLAIDKTTHTLLSVEILAKKSDVTRYCFLNVRTNVELPKDVFVPTDGKLPPSSQPSGSNP